MQKCTKPFGVLDEEMDGREAVSGADGTPKVGGAQPGPTTTQMHRDQWKMSVMTGGAFGLLFGERVEKMEVGVVGTKCETVQRPYRHGVQSALCS